MASQLQNPRDVVSGALVIATGAAFLFVGRNLPVGTASRMGSGYFPIMLSLLMIALGIAIIVNTLRLARTERTEATVPWASLALIMGSVIFFALALTGLGMFATLIVSTLAAASASRYAKWRASFVLALLVAVSCVGAFVYGLGLRIPIFGPWLTPEFWSVLASPKP